MFSKKNLYLQLKEETYVWFEALIGCVPGRLGKYSRAILYSFIFANFRKKNFTIGQSVQLWFPWNMVIGRHSHVSKNCQIAALHSGDIVMGDNVMIGPYSMLTSVVHNFDSLHVPIKRQGLTSKSIRIGDDCWIGGHVCIVPGVSIGRGVIIGAGSVVTHDIPNYTIAAGVPAKVIKQRSTMQDV